MPKYIFFIFCFFAIHIPFYSEPLPGKPSILFNPLENDEYTQAWNLFFYNNETTAQITFIIGNLGPGNLNNGYAVFVHNNKKEIIFIKELNSKTLITEKKKLYIAMDQSNILKKTSKRQISGKAFSNDDQTVSIELFPSNSFASLNNSVLLKKDHFINQDMHLITPRATLTIESSKEKQVFHGWGGMEHLRLDSLPNHYAQSFIIARSKPGRNMIVITGFHGNSGYDEKPEFKYFILKNNITVKSGKITTVENSEKTIKSDKKPYIPEKIKMITDASGNCSITINNRLPKGRLDVFTNVTPFFKWILKLVFTEPSIIYYYSQMKYSCNNNNFTTEALINFITL